MHKNILKLRGVYPPEAMMHFSLFQISLPFPNHFQTPWKMFPILLFPPKIPYDFVKFTCFLHTLCVFRFPTYFDHDAFMHHTMHVLDAHAQIRWNPKSKLPKWLLVVSLMSSSVYPIGAKLRGSQTFSTTWCRRDTLWAGCYMYTMHDKIHIRARMLRR